MRSHCQCGFRRVNYSFPAPPWGGETGPGLFAFVSALPLAMFLGAIAYHTLKAARTNPVDALRHE